MRNNPDVFVNSTDQGIKKVKQGGYAYLLESVSNDYVRQRDCELMQVGGLLDSKSYGIGTPSGNCAFFIFRYRSSIGSSSVTAAKVIVFDLE